MKKHKYIVIPAGFVEKYSNGKLKIGVNQFHAVQTLDGRWVTSINALDEFPNQMQELSRGNSPVFDTVELTPDDFPKYDINGNRIN